MKIIVEIRGGVLEAIYAEKPNDLEITLVDHDCAEMSGVVANPRQDIDLNDFATYDRR